MTARWPQCPLFLVWLLLCVLTAGVPCMLFGAWVVRRSAR